jgi:hypothetical protein
VKKVIVTIALALSAYAGAEVVHTPWTPEQVTLNKDTIIQQTFTGATADADCKAALDAKVEVKGSGNYFCVGRTGTRATKLSNCPAAPASSQVNTCSGTNTPPWTQTRTVTRLVRTKEGDACWGWTPWAPATIPSTACQPPTAPPVTDITWSNVAYENCQDIPAPCSTSFTLTARKNVRFGVFWMNPAPTPVVKAFDPGTYTCSIATFGSDPKNGSRKSCEVSSEVLGTVTPPPVEPPASQPTSMYSNPNVPLAATAYTDGNTAIARLQRPAGGWSVDMLIATTEVAPSSDIGAFRTGCQPTKIMPVDPIVYPGQYGVSHPHTFFGNTGVDENTTTETLLSKGNSTCRGGTINKSSYWVPSMVDMRTGKFVPTMLESNFYYKTGYALPPSVITDVPVGLRMIAGSAAGTPTNPSSAAIYACVWNGGNSDWSASIPTNCKGGDGSWLIMGIDFPQCWDGVNLDSPDHKSHMANPVNVRANNTGNCPASHPVALPQIAYQILYPVPNTGDTAFWRLSSDNYPNTLPAGYSGHGDYWMRWKPEIVHIWTEKCDQAQKDCHSHLLGDGRAMVIP